MSIYPKIQGFVDECVFFFFFLLCRHWRWASKLAGKQNFGKVPSRLFTYPVGLKFHWNALSRTVAEINAFYVEIHDGCQKWPVDSASQKGHQNLFSLLRFRDKHVFAFYAEISFWREIDFCENLPLDSADTLWVKKFVEIALSSTVIDINGFLRFTQKFKMAAKTGRKRFMWKLASIPYG